MLEALRRASRPRDLLELSLEERMACGVGVCRGCVTPVREGEDWRYAAICREGPVFDASELASTGPGDREGEGAAAGPDVAPGPGASAARGEEAAP
jgi:hypothetical protein